jgi:hypothetical protein
MKNLNPWSRQAGIGFLVLKNGSKQSVEWEADLHHDGLIGNGCIRGDEKLLETAAKDGCATLHLSSNATAAIAIEHYEQGEASFSTLLSSPHLFRAQTIVGSSPVLDGATFSMQYLDADGETLTVVVPTVVMRDYLPVLREALPPSSPDAASTGFIRIPKTWRTGTTRSKPFVIINFNDETPWALDSEGARELAAQLIEWTELLETRSQTEH